MEKKSRKQKAKLRGIQILSIILSFLMVSGAIAMLIVYLLR